jgi:Outer membrane protein beta-barrel domain
MPSVRRRAPQALLAIILGAALGRSDVLARDTDKSWEVGAYIIASRYAGASNMDNGYGFGVRGGYHPKAIHELEGSLDQASADNSQVSGISYDITKLNVDYVRVLLLKGREKIAPFAVFGVGLVNVDNGNDSITHTAYRAGGGFKYFFNPRVGFRFDVKIYRWHGGGTVLPGDEPFFSADATFAATFLIGGAK